MTDYQVAIPSRGRPDALTRLTLPWLAAGDVDPDRVTVFVHTDDPDVRAYADLATDHGLRLHVHDAPGILGQRATIAAHYPAGTPVAVADDDITALRRATTVGDLVDVTDVHGWLTRAFEETVGRDLWGWGVAAVPNPFYLHPGRVTDGLRFCIGTLHGFIARPGHPVHDLTVPVKEDYEWSLRSWWWDGGIVRFGDTAVVADHYRLPGGCVDTRTPDTSAAAATRLLDDWPGLVRRNTRRKGPHTEILLATKARTLGHDRHTPPPGRG